MELIRTQVDSVEVVQAAGDTPRLYKARLFTQRANTRGDIVMVDGMDTTVFEANPVVLFNHARYDLPIGRAPKIIRNARSMDAEIEFDPDDERAQAIEGKIQRGFIKSFSIGFKVLEAEPVDPKSRDYFPPMRFTKTQLHEISVVALPADNTAVIKQAWSEYHASQRPNLSRADFLRSALESLGDC